MKYSWKHQSMYYLIEKKNKGWLCSQRSECSRWGRSLAEVYSVRDMSGRQANDSRGMPEPCFPYEHEYGVAFSLSVSLCKQWAIQEVKRWKEETLFAFLSLYVTVCVPYQGSRETIKKHGQSHSGSKEGAIWEECNAEDRSAYPVKTRQSSVQMRMSTWLNMAECVRWMARWRSFCRTETAWSQCSWYCTTL